MRASLEHPEVQVVAVNDPFIDLEYMVIDIKSHIVLVLISRNTFWSHDIKQVHILGFDNSWGVRQNPELFCSHSNYYFMDFFVQVFAESQ